MVMFWFLLSLVFVLDGVWILRYLTAYKAVKILKCLLLGYCLQVACLSSRGMQFNYISRSDTM